MLTPLLLFSLASCGRGTYRQIQALALLLGGCVLSWTIDLGTAREAEKQLPRCCPVISPLNWVEEGRQGAGSGAQVRQCLQLRGFRGQGGTSLPLPTLKAGPGWRAGRHRDN